MAWLVRRLGVLQEHANRISQIPLGRWWTISLAVITPMVLGVQAVLNFRQALTENYEGYPTSFLLIAGWSVALGAFVAGVLLSIRGWNPATLGLEGETRVDLREEERS